ncbi:MAG: flavoprotein [Planctomycetota bacterium]
MTHAHRVLLGVSASIAAYKAAEVTSKLAQAGVSVTVLMTPNATKFIGAATFQALSWNPVFVDQFGGEESTRPEHIDLAEKAELFLIAPATANLIGKLASGIADDMITTTALAYPRPLLIAPAMNTQMWSNPIVQDNLAKLRRFGHEVFDPDSGKLACGTVGPGRLAEPEMIVQAVLQRLGVTEP